ncbi:MAG: flagellar protein [Actinobacteria bacterium]|nr:flagellar protein [Actinomycetota bacterium]
MKQKVSFEKILESKKSELTEIKFSQHAQNRLRERNITMSSNDYMRLRNAIHKISQKGGRESLVLMDNQAFLVSAENSTVITAIDGSNMRENVFTNIDSAIII